MTGGPRTTRELYDAFGEVSDDDDDDDDETTALRQKPLARSVGFHSGFLDDDEPSTAAGLTPKYRDDPDHNHHTGSSQSKDDEVAPRDPESPAESGSSWEHASRE